MTTTLGWLQTKDGARLALVLAFDGYDLLATTADDPSKIETAWAATDWTNAIGGLSIVGETTQQIELFDPRINADSLTFTVADTDDTLRGSLLSPLAPADRTYLAANVTAGQTTSIAVKNVDDFDTSGTVYIGQEGIGYTSTSTVSDYVEGTITRGKWSLFGVDGGTRCGASHRLQPNTSTNEVTAPIVTSAPRVWYNRKVALYAHHWEAGAWSTKANARLVWAGRIKSYRDNGDGSVSLECRSVLELLESSIMSDQLRGKVGEGVFLREEDTKVVLQRISASGTAIYATSATFATSESLFTWREAIASVNTALDSMRATLDPDSVTFFETYDATDSKPRVGATWAGSTLAGGSVLEIGLSPRVWQLLGYYDGAPGTIPWGSVHMSAGYLYLNRRPWATEGNTRETATGDGPPLRHLGGLLDGTVAVSDVTGTWASQSGYMPTSIMSGGNGFLRIGDALYPVTYDTGANTFTLAGSPVLGTTGIADLDYVLEGEDYAAPDVYQVWFEEGGAGSILLRLLESTGSSTYNHATYDAYPVGMGLAVPDGMVNVPSFEAVNDDLPTYELFIEKPTPFPEILESVCAVTGRYPVWKNGAVALTKAPAGAPGLSSAYSLTEANKARIDDRPRVTYSRDGLINRATLEYQTDPGGKLDNSFTAEDVVSIADFGPSKIATIKGRGLFDHTAWLADVATPALAYFSRPLAHLERTFDFSLVDMAPGDPVLVTDDYVVHPRTGTRGITAVPMWLTRVSFNWRTGIGTATCVFNPETDERRLGVWAPSARVSSYVAATAAITTTTNSFVDSTESYDASHFAVNDLVRVVEVSPAASGTYSSWTGTVSSVSSNVISLTADGTAGAGIDAAKRYVVEYDDIATVQTSQQAKCFIADDANNSTGLSANDAFRWWSDPSADALSVAAITYTNEFVRPYDLQDDTGEPASVHKLWYLVDSLNNLYGYKTSNILIQDGYLPSAITNTTTTEKLCYGPIKVPIYGHPSRTLKFRIYGQTNNAGDAAVFKVYSSIAPPSGTALTSLVFPDSGATSATRSTTGVSLGWTTEQTIAPRVAGFGPAYTWITVTTYITTGGGGHTATFRGICLAESSL